MQAEKRKVAIVAPSYGTDALFKSRDFKTTIISEASEKRDYDFVVFTGGADIDPSLYGQENKGLSYPSPERDARDLAVFNLYKDAPTTQFIGICRGAQFLTAVHGGFLLQHVNGHAGNIIHPVYTDDNQVKMVNSEHHQVCFPQSEKTTLFASTDAENFDESFFEAFCLSDNYDKHHLCVQFHPEWGHKETTDYFWELFERMYK
jgi:gamma-glutamyl-gamma-aminobutyrate hydrolase PuuD